MMLDRFIALIARFGVEDRVLAVFMLAGPAVIVTLIVAGRSAGTIAITAAYVCLFVLYVAYKGTREGD